MVSIALHRQGTTPNPNPDSVEMTTYNFDVATLGVPALIREELALRSRCSRGPHPGRYVVERLAAIEVALARDGGR